MCVLLIDFCWQYVYGIGGGTGCPQHKVIRWRKIPPPQKKGGGVLQYFLLLTSHISLVRVSLKFLGSPQPNLFTKLLKTIFYLQYLCILFILISHYPFRTVPATAATVSSFCAGLRSERVSFSFLP